MAKITGNDGNNPISSGAAAVVANQSDQEAAPVAEEPVDQTDLSANDDAVQPEAVEDTTADSESEALTSAPVTSEVSEPAAASDDGESSPRHICQRWHGK